MPVTVETPESVADVVGALGDGAMVIAGGTHVMPRINTEAHESARSSASAAPAWPASRSTGRRGDDRRRDDARARSAPTSGSRSCGPASSRSPRRRSATSRRSAATCSSSSPTATSRSRCSRWTPQVDLAGVGGKRDACGCRRAHDGVPAGARRHRRPLRTPADGEWRYTKAMRRRLNSASIVTARRGPSGGPARADRARRRRRAGRCARPPRRPCWPAGRSTASARRRRARAALEDAEPFTDAYASAWYRARVLPVHVRRALIGEAA